MRAHAAPKKSSTRTPTTQYTKRQTSVIGRFEAIIKVSGTLWTTERMRGAPFPQIKWRKVQRFCARTLLIIDSCKETVIYLIPNSVDRWSEIFGWEFLWKKIPWFFLWHGDLKPVLRLQEKDFVFALADSSNIRLDELILQSSLRLFFALNVWQTMNVN